MTQSFFQLGGERERERERESEWGVWWTHEPKPPFTAIKVSPSLPGSADENPNDPPQEETDGEQLYNTCPQLALLKTQAAASEINS